jgi:type III secretory pathway component EscU
MSNRQNAVFYFMCLEMKDTSLPKCALTCLSLHLSFVRCICVSLLIKLLCIVVTVDYVIEFGRLHVYRNLKK